MYHDIGALLRQTGQGNGPDRGVSLSTFRFASRSDEPETAKKKIVKMVFFFVKTMFLNVVYLILVLPDCSDDFLHLLEEFSFAGRTRH